MVRGIKCILCQGEPPRGSWRVKHKPAFHHVADSCANVRPSQTFKDHRQISVACTMNFVFLA